MVCLLSCEWEGSQNLVDAGFLLWKRGGRGRHRTKRAQSLSLFFGGFFRELFISVFLLKRKRRGKMMMLGKMILFFFCGTGEEHRWFGVWFCVEVLFNEIIKKKKKKSWKPNKRFITFNSQGEGFVVVLLDPSSQVAPLVLQTQEEDVLFPSCLQKKKKKKKIKKWRRKGGGEKKANQEIHQEASWGAYLGAHLAQLG